ncbi:MAG: MFS transporter [Pseudomonadota bacterium]
MRRLFTIAAVIIAGEMVFALPFHTARFFRPTFLEAFSLSNTELGDLFAVYGIVAMLAYFPGGTLADRYPARTLITASLLLTALGGAYLTSMPGVLGLAVVYGFWGISTVFLLWGAMLRATRLWGGERTQGIAFGSLEAGRGLVAVLAAALAIWVLEGFLPAAVESATEAERVLAMRYVIGVYAALTLAAAALAWMLIPAESPRTDSAGVVGSSLRGMLDVARRPTLWAHAGVILCAYCAYKGIDNYSLYAQQVLGMNEVEAAKLVRDGSWLRPFGAIAAGLIADRFRAGQLIAILFAGLAVAYALIATTGQSWVLYANLFLSFLFVFALRAVYFALLEENRTPRHLTGTSVGFVSFVGFTPEFFFGPVTGRILDAAPGAAGHRHYFLFLLAVGILGLVLTVTMLRLRPRAESGQPGAAPG